MIIQTKALDGISFAEKPNTLFVDLRKLSDALGWTVRWEQTRQLLYVNEQLLTSRDTVKRLLDGTSLLAVGTARSLGGEVLWDNNSGSATITHRERQVQVTRGQKRVEVDCTTQQLRAWQGDSLILETPVSTGGAGHRTPTGDFTAGPIKVRIHYSSLYNNAPMPYSVQVIGNIFLHGHTSVPRFPASHGCVRIPLNRGNPAQWLYEWIDRGTTIRIQGRWQG
jgi:hypothetical protein